MTKKVTKSKKIVRPKKVGVWEKIKNLLLFASKTQVIGFIVITLLLVAGISLATYFLIDGLHHHHGAGDSCSGAMNS